MVAEARLKSKNLYKVELYLLKIMPMVIALAYLVNTVSSYFGVDIPILASIAGMSLIPLIFMYISSYVFKFCEYHRMFLHYIAVGVIPVSATPTDVYVAINSQYHDYVELFKSWFGDNVDQKIIESAIIFWFKDVDCKSRNKVVSYFKEY